MSTNFNGPVFIGKVATLVMGVVILGVGLHSHFQSSWVKQIPPQLDPSWGFGNIKTYKFCDLRNRYPLFRVKPCPHISMERFYVAIIIISFIMTLLALIAEFAVDMGSRVLKLIDMGYHGIVALLLLIAGIVYLVSAIQIDNLLGKNNGIVFPIESLGYNFRKGEKIAAGVLTLMQALLYGVTVALIAMRSGNGPRRQTKEDFVANLRN